MTGLIQWAMLWLGAVSLITFVLFGWDKRMAILGRRRIPEATLLSASLIGGGPGGVLAMWLFRHKTRKPPFPWAVPLMACIQLVLLAVMFLLLR